jgi:hypothetical protein
MREPAPKKDLRGIFMRILAVALSMCLVASGAIAAGTNAPLAPGKPAGVKQAQIDRTALIVVVGIAGAIAAIALGVASNGNPGNPVGLTQVPSTTAATVP